MKFVLKKRGYLVHAVFATSLAAACTKTFTFAVVVSVLQSDFPKKSEGAETNIVADDARDTQILINRRVNSSVHLVDVVARAGQEELWAVVRVCVSMLTCISSGLGL
jgi:hypothetical protein